ncbi:putative wd repeat protein [Diplodia seriata]|uniref:Putative wd repeat protein n=1 Tax=Diplodia seriata TaxID=420778 RepID=A0A0G2EK03_9PEZI|nr:putative wd repeat protein [Diplodia seriata]
MVAFSPDDSLLFTAGYDNQVRVYDIFDTEQPEKHFSCLALRHTAKVDLLSVSPQGLLATGCQRSDKNSIKVIDPYLLNVDPSELFDEDGNKMKPVMHSFSSRRAAERPENGIFPSALCFDWTGDYLLAGFASTLKEELASGDGVVKTWDPYRAPEDVFVRDVVQLNSGVMSGAFSPDYASLLIGEVNGTINLLEAGQLGRSIKQMDTFNLVSFKDEEASPPTPDLQDPSPDKDSGASIARELLRTDQMTLRQMGSLPIRQAVQGPNYAGPYDKAADAPELRTAAAQFQRLHSDPPTQQCGLLACRLAAAFINAVPEEAGDSGRSADRIPAALRSLALAATPPIREDDADGNGNGTSSMPAKTTIVPFAPKCSKCHVRPARPRAETDNGDIVDDDDDDDEQGVSSPSKNLLPLCERCNFGCPRCGRKAGILSRTPETTFAGVFCLRCRAVWRADVLGYKLVYQHTGKEDWDPRRDERFLYERARVMGIRKKVPSPPSASGAAEASPDGSGGSAAAGTANTGKKRAKETQLEKQRRRGHDYLAKEGEDSIEGYYHGLWQDRPPSPL